MSVYFLYLEARYDWRAFGNPPIQEIGNKEENLVFANLVMQGTLYGRERFIRELTKRTGRQWS